MADLLGKKIKENLVWVDPCLEKIRFPALWRWRDVASFFRRGHESHLAPRLARPHPQTSAPASSRGDTRCSTETTCRNSSLLPRIAPTMEFMKNRFPRLKPQISFFYNF